MILLTQRFIYTVSNVAIAILFQLFFIRYVSDNVDKAIYNEFVLLQTLVDALSVIFLFMSYYGMLAALIALFFACFLILILQIAYVNKFKRVPSV